MSNKLYIFDGMAFVFRSFYAIRSNLTDSAGRPTNAIYGFTRVLLKLLREHEPSHVVVVFDHPGPTFRSEMYPEYKATRRETPPELLEQIPRIQEVVEALNLPVISTPGVEADDVMGSLARCAEAQDIETVLVTGDKDMLQLITDLVRVYDPAKGDDGVWYDAASVVERFGVAPQHVVDALALIGDAADNVPGVPGIGEKTAKKLMTTYARLETLYERIDELKGKQKERLAEGRDQAFLSRTLVTLKTDVDCGFMLEQYERRAPDREKLIDVFSELGFHALLQDMTPEAQAEAEAVEAAEDYQLILTEDALAELVEKLRASGRFALDTETTSVDPMRAELVGLSFCCCGGQGYYLPVAHRPEALCLQRDPEDLASWEAVDCVPKQKALDMLRPLLEDPAVEKIGHNIKYDLQVLTREGIALRGIWMDTMVASYLTDPGRLRHNLNDLSLQYFRRKLIPISDLIGKGAKAVTFDHVALDPARCYACEDADMAWRLAELFAPQLKAQALESLYRDIELPLIDVLARMERNGISLDLELFERLRGEIRKRLDVLSEEIFESAGEPFLINSPKQLQYILFEKLGLKPVRRTRTGYSTDMDVLEVLAPQHALPRLILEYRMLEKLRGTYVEALPQLVHPETGRIHTSFNQTVAATGRLSSSDPNLQNIPVRTDFGRRIREGFVPAEGCALISCDYSQIELRILAHLSGDAALQEAFVQGADIHRDTAGRVFQVEPEAVTPEMRRQAKAVNFGVVYGISAFGLARNIGVSNAEAAEFIDAYFRQYPGVRAWLDATLERAHKQGYVTTLMQRRRYLPELNSSAGSARRAAERMAINTPVQGSAADIIKKAMLTLDEALQDSEAKMLLQVHDELVLEAPKEEAEGIAAATKRIMEEAFPLDVPLVVDMGIGANWAQIH